LALLAEPGVGTEAMAELGITHDRLADRVRELTRVNGKRVRYRESKGITTNPAAHDVWGWARGYAAASGRQTPTPEDLLLAVLYISNGIVTSVLREFGSSAAAVVDALRARGVAVPQYQPVEDQPWRGIRKVEVARSEWRSVVDVLNEKHPAGSRWRWGFNSTRDRPGKIQFFAEQGIDLAAIVEMARARAASTGS
jgi:hypothetical protein